MALYNRVPRGFKVPVQIRGMATEKQIKQRISSTSNISKITKSMKMVSAAKMRGAQNRLDAGRPFSQWMDNMFSAPRIIATAKEIPEAGEKNMFVVVTSDRGLCGGCNSAIAKATRTEVERLESDGKAAELVVVGDKGRSQLRRTNGNAIQTNVADCWAVPPSFAGASAIAEVILRNDYDKAHLVFNTFVSAIKYEPSIRVVGKFVDEGDFSEYEFEPDNKLEVLEDMHEFSLATGIFHSMIESNTSEESSRMAAMENASKNAGELIGRLTLAYNRARQTRITTELIEIISGASSLDG